VRLAIQKHLRDFVALFLMALVALGTTAYILSQERFHLPKWVPGLGADFYKVNVEFSNAQAVVPGQGQTMNIAGVKVGDVQSVHLRNGLAVVSVNVEKKYAPVYRDAHVLLRPKTGLKDMYLALDPGTKAAGALKSGGTIPVNNTLPDVNPDEVLSVLDSDTRSYLQILLGSGGQAFTDKPGVKQSASADLREIFKRFEPTNRDLAKLMSELGKRRDNIRHVVHNFRLIADQLAETDGTLGRFVESANANFQAFANQDQNLRAALGLLPGTLTTTRDTLRKADTLAKELGPTAQALRPTARALGPALRDVRPFLRETTPVIRDQLRPFTRIARPTVRDLRPTAHDLAAVTPRLGRTFKVVNALLNTFAYNPPGKEEGFLFWQSWLNHAGSTVFATQDAHGPIRRGLVLVSCDSLGVLDQIAASNPALKVLIDLLATPRRSDICPQQVTQSPTGSTGLTGVLPEGVTGVTGVTGVLPTVRQAPHEARVKAVSP
jgi:phospholipid/cholesterol/gamma-HCH transport system substrate-binding protein